MCEKDHVHACTSIPAPLPSLGESSSAVFTGTSTSILSWSKILELRLLGKGKNDQMSFVPFSLSASWMRIYLCIKDEPGLPVSQGREGQGQD